MAPAGLKGKWRFALYDHEETRKERQDEVTRSLWTLVIPTLCALFPLLLLRFAAHDPVTNEVSPMARALYTLVPPLGVVSVLIWAASTRTFRPLRPLYPYVAVALCYSATDLVVEVSYHYGVLESAKWLGAVELVALLTYPLQPLCAVVGGLIFNLRRRPGRIGIDRSRTHLGHRLTPK